MNVVLPAPFGPRRLRNLSALDFEGEILKRINLALPAEAGGVGFGKM